MLDAKVATLEVLAKLGDDARKDQILRVFLERCYIYDIHHPVLEAPEWQVADSAGIGDQARAPGRNVRQTVANLPDRRDVMCAPRIRIGFLETAEQILEPVLEIGERLNPMVAREVTVLLEHAVEDTLIDEVDQRIRFRVDVIAIEENLRVLQHLAQTPGERRHVVEQRLVRAKRVEREALCGVGSEVAHTLERLWRHSHFFIQLEVALVETPGLIDETEIRSLHVEADGGNRPLAVGEMREHRREQPLDRARFRRQSRHARDVEVRRLRPEQKFGVEIDRRIGRTRTVNADGNSCGRAFLEVSVHPQRYRNVFLLREVHFTHRHRLQRLIGDLAQYGCGIKPDLRTVCDCKPRICRRAVVTHYIVHRRLKVGIAESFYHDAVHARDLTVHGDGAVNPHDGADSNRRLERGPEMKLVRRVRPPLRGNYSAEGLGQEIALRNSSVSRRP